MAAARKSSRGRNKNRAILSIPQPPLPPPLPSRGSLADARPEGTPIRGLAPMSELEEADGEGEAAGDVLAEVSIATDLELDLLDEALFQDELEDAHGAMLLTEVLEPGRGPVGAFAGMPEVAQEIEPPVLQADDLDGPDIDPIGFPEGELAGETGMDTGEIEAAGVNEPAGECEAPGPVQEIEAGPATEIELAQAVELRMSTAPEVEPSPAPEIEPVPAPEIEPVPAPEIEPPPAPEIEPAPVPEIEPPSAPEIAPPSAPEVEPPPAPEVEPPPAPEIEPSRIPEVEPPPAPEIEPSRIPEVEPPPTPEIEPPPAPEIEPPPAPEIEPSRVPEVEPFRMPEIEPSRIPEVEPFRMPEIEPLPAPGVEIPPTAGLEQALRPEPQQTAASTESPDPAPEEPSREVGEAAGLPPESLSSEGTHTGEDSSRSGVHNGVADGHEVRFQTRLPTGMLELAEQDGHVRAPALHHLINLRIAHQQQDLEALRTAFLDGIRDFPDEGGLYAYLGLALLGWGGLAEARAVLAEGLERDPDCRSLFEVLIELELRVGHRESARKLLRTALERFEPDGPMMQRCARQAVRLGELGLAQGLVRRALERGDTPSEGLLELKEEIRRRREAVHTAAGVELRRILARDLHAPLEVMARYVELAGNETDTARRQHYLSQIGAQIQALHALAGAARGSMLDEG